MAIEGVTIARQAARHVGLELTADQEAQLASYVEWLRSEAIPSGGLGPREGDRIWSRHIADSLSLALAWRDYGPPAEMLDVGSGVGLPGIPLAIAWPDTQLTLLDRGGRRVRLLHRVVRILALGNVTIAQGDVFSVADEWEAVAFRGSVTAPEAVGLSSRLLRPEGIAVVALSRRPDPPERGRDLVILAESLGLQCDMVAIPAEVLESTAWLLIMRQSGPTG